MSCTPFDVQSVFGCDSPISMSVPSFALNNESNLDKMRESYLSLDFGIEKIMDFSKPPLHRKSQLFSPTLQYFTFCIISHQDSAS